MRQSALFLSDNMISKEDACNIQTEHLLITVCSMQKIIPWHILTRTLERSMISRGTLSVMLESEVTVLTKYWSHNAVITTLAGM